MKNNSILTITAYQHNGMWVFDDESVGLVKEPFVAGADIMCDRLSNGKPALTLIFSVIEFPGHKLVLDRVSGDSETGIDYITCPIDDTCDHLGGLLIWLCPALNLYFPELPDTIYVDYKPLDGIQH